MSTAFERKFTRKHLSLGGGGGKGQVNRYITTHLNLGVTVKKHSSGQQGTPESFGSCSPALKEVLKINEMYCFLVFIMVTVSGVDQSTFSQNP